MASKMNNEWIKFSVTDYCKYSEIMSYGFYELGLKKGDRVVTITNNRPEFNIIDMALSMLGVVHVPIYPTLSKNEYTYIVNHSDAKVVIIGTKSIYNKVKPVFDTFEQHPRIYTLDRIEGEELLFSVFKQGVYCRRKDASLIAAIKETIQPDDVATQIYTSGTTGTPKGVVLTHHNLISNFMAHVKVEPMDSHCRVLSFLPLCHVFERSMNYHYQYLGISIYYVDNMGLILQYSQEVKAHGFCTVPRILEVMHDKIVSTSKDLSGIRKMIFNMAIQHGYRYDFHKHFWYNMWQKVFDLLVYSEIRKKFGGNEMTIISGGSALNERLARLFHAMGLRIYEGYGLSESGPVIAVNNPVDGLVKIGTVGPPLPMLQLKIAEDGEIIVKSPSVMQCYYKDEAYTALAIDEDGWFHTGDVGVLVDGTYLKITDRKKEIFKLSAGKYVVPQYIENKMKESELIENAMVIGENEKFASALISPNYNYLHFWANKHKLHYRDNSELIQIPEVQQRFQKEILQINKDLAPHEQIKCFQLVTDEWSPNTGELSPTLKLKRAILMKKYKEEIAKIYNHEQEKDSATTVFSFKQINLSILNTLQEFWNKGSEGNVIEVSGKRFEKYISRDKIDKRVGELVTELNREYEGESPVVLVVLTGAIMFASDLLKQLHFPLEMACIKLVSYQGMQQGETVKEVIGLPERMLENRRVIVVEDIVDSGNTINFLYKKLKECKVKEVQVATLTLKKDCYKTDFPIRYVGFEISKEFIVGYGLDYNQQGRQYPDIYQHVKE